MSTPPENLTPNLPEEDSSNSVPYADPQGEHKYGTVSDKLDSGGTNYPLPPAGYKVEYDEELNEYILVFSQPVSIEPPQHYASDEEKEQYIADFMARMQADQTVEDRDSSRADSITTWLGNLTDLITETATIHTPIRSSAGFKRSKPQAYTGSWIYTAFNVPPEEPLSELENDPNTYGNLSAEAIADIVTELKEEAKKFATGELSAPQALEILEIAAVPDSGDPRKTSRLIVSNLNTPVNLGGSHLADKDTIVTNMRYVQQFWQRLFAHGMTE